MNIEKARAKFLEGIKHERDRKRFREGFHSDPTVLKNSTQNHSKAATKLWHEAELFKRLKKSPVYVKQATQGPGFGLQTPIGQKFAGKVLTHKAIQKLHTRFGSPS